MPKEKIRILSGDRSELKIGISNELEMKLKRVRQIIGPDKSLEQVLSEMADFYLKHKDAVQKAKRVMAKKSKSTKRSVTTQTISRATLGNLPAHVRHEVNQRDEGRCRALLPDNSLCASTAWVECHHVKPRSRGGADIPDNLVTLCSSHHRLAHQTGLQNLRL